MPTATINRHGILILANISQYLMIIITAIQYRSDAVRYNESHLQFDTFQIYYYNNIHCNLTNKRKKDCANSE